MNTRYAFTSPCVEIFIFHMYERGQTSNMDWMNYLVLHVSVNIWTLEYRYVYFEFLPVPVLIIGSDHNFDWVCDIIEMLDEYLCILFFWGIHLYICHFHNYTNVGKLFVVRNSSMEYILRTRLDWMWPVLSFGQTMSNSY